jgi:hypothetical protein
MNNLFFILLFTAITWLVWRVFKKFTPTALVSEPISKEEKAADHLRSTLQFGGQPGSVQHQR